MATGRLGSVEGRKRENVSMVFCKVGVYCVLKVVSEIAPVVCVWQAIAVASKGYFWTNVVSEFVYIAYGSRRFVWNYAFQEGWYFHKFAVSTVFRSRLFRTSCAAISEWMSLLWTPVFAGPIPLDALSMFYWIKPDYPFKGHSGLALCIALVSSSSMPSSFQRFSGLL